MGVVRPCVGGRLRRDRTLPCEMGIVRVCTARHPLEIVVREFVCSGGHRLTQIGKHDERIDVRVTLHEANAKVRRQANTNSLQKGSSRFVEKSGAERDVGFRSGKDGIQRGALILEGRRHV